MKRSLKKILKKFLPNDIIVLHRKYEDYKRIYKNKKEKEYVFDVIFSAGIACRPAHYLKKHGLRVCANPLDWMHYSLDTVIHLYQTKFADFFTDFVEDKQKSHWFVDIKNNIITTHYPNIGNDNKTFREIMKNRFERVNKRLLKANKICFIANRDESIENFSKFLKEMGSMYSGKITCINIRNNQKINDIILSTREKITEKLELIEYEFNDVHPDGGNNDSNPNFWHGNVYLWDSLFEKISIKTNFLSYLLRNNKK